MTSLKNVAAIVLTSSALAWAKGASLSMPKMQFISSESPVREMRAATSAKPTGITLIQVTSLFSGNVGKSLGEAFGLCCSSAAPPSSDILPCSSRGVDARGMHLGTRRGTPSTIWCWALLMAP